LVKRYVSELGSQWVNTLISQTATRVYISRLAEAEVSAALTRRLSTAHATRVLHDFDEDVLNTYLSLEITNDLINDAVQLTRQHRLRGCDALQLATARQLAQLEPDLIFICSDHDLLTAAVAESLNADNPEIHP
jgi:uncharacterized protein